MRILELGYVVVAATDIEKWRSFATDVLGMMAIDTPEGGLHLKMDGRQFRFLIQKSDSDRLFSSAWQVVDADALAEARTELKAAGVEVIEPSDEERKVRYVQDFISFVDPAGNRQEIFWGPISDFKRFVSPIASRVS